MTDFTSNSINMRNVSDFSVRFLGIPENQSNTMSKYLLSMTRPQISFGVGNHNQKSFTYKVPNKPSYSSVELEFRDDENSAMSTMIHVQVMKQLSRRNSPSQNGSDFEDRFDTEVSLLNMSGDIKEQYKLKNCFLSNITYKRLDYRQHEEKSIITATLEFDNIAFMITDMMKENLFLGDADVFDWVSLF